jgi:hypothetical protein
MVPHLTAIPAATRPACPHPTTPARLAPAGRTTTLPTRKGLAYAAQTALSALFPPQTTPNSAPSKRRISDIIFARLQADARQAGARQAGASGQGPGGQPGNDSAASAAGSHPEHRLFGQATPGPKATLRPRPDPQHKKATSPATRKTAKSP